MFVKDNISLSRKYTHICGAETCCTIPNTRNSSDGKKQHKIEDRLVETRAPFGYDLIDATDRHS